MERYNFKTIEKKWQTSWKENKTFKSEIDKNKKNFIVLKCSISFRKNTYRACRNYTIGDVLSRKRLQGFNVLHPMGWDSFGMTENAAKQNNLDPRDWTEKTLNNEISIETISLSIDWDRDFHVFCDYYKHQ